MNRVNPLRDGRGIEREREERQAAPGERYRLDDRRRGDPTLERVIETLRARRRSRWRAPPG
jgi:hypothetical protein